MRTETLPTLMQNRALSAAADSSPDAISLSEATFLLAWFEIARMENARAAGLDRGRLDAAPNLSTGSTNTGVQFLGRGLIPSGWRQGRGLIDPTGANNGLIWELIAPGDSGDSTPMARTLHYDGAKGISFLPVDGDSIVSILFVAGVARSLVVDLAHRTAVITVIAGTTTYAEIAADWAADTDAGQLATISGDSGTIPATFVGGVLYLCASPLVEYVQGGSTAVGWAPTTRTVTVTLDIAGGGDSVANIKSALAASASGAQYVFQVRDYYGSSGAGDVTVPGWVQVMGGAGSALCRASLLMAQGAHKDLLFEDREFGTDAKPKAIRLVNVAAAEPPQVEVHETEEMIEVRILAKVGTATALHIRQALRDSYAAMEAISVRLAPGSNGSGTPAAFALTAMTGGDDSAGLALTAGNVEATGFTTLTDDGFLVDVPALGSAYPADSHAVVRVRICGVTHEIPAVVVT